MNSPSIEFLIKENLENFMFNPERKEGLAFEATDSSLNISIKPTLPDDDGFGHHSGIEARILMRVPCTIEQAAYVDALIERRIAPYGPRPMNLPFKNKDKVVADESGNIQKGASFWFEWLPEDLKSLIEQTFSKMWREFHRFVKLYRWQQNEQLSLPSPGQMSGYWRTQYEGLYSVIPLRGSSFSGATLGGFHWDDQDQRELDLLWSQRGLEEPLAHELRGEAELIKDSSPRSALLMCASALEVGVKAHIGRVAPVADWLVFNVPSPPIYKVLRDYLPSIHEENPSALDWSALKPLFKRCQELAEDRNKLTHAGNSPNTEIVESYLTVVSDVLYLLDHLEGHAWVAEHVTYGTRKALDWQEPRHKRFHFEMKSGPDVG